MRILNIIGGCMLAALFSLNAPAVKAQASVTTSECIVMTWYGGAAGTRGKAVKGQIDSSTGKGTYAWKNGKLTFSQLGDEGGQLNGMEGTWKQDGSEGIFAVKGNYYRKPAVGTWSSKGSKAKSKLTIGLCK